MNKVVVIFNPEFRKLEPVIQKTIKQSLKALKK